jgi:ATP-dependent helicase HrpB
LRLVGESSPPSQKGGQGGFRSAPIEAPTIGRIVALAYPERVARRRDEVGVFLCADGGEARLPREEALAHAPWLAIAHWDPGPPRRIRRAAALDFADVERDHAARIRTEIVVHWDAASETVVAEAQRRFGALVLARHDRRGAAGEAVVAAMLEGVRSLGLAALPWTEGARQWQARVLSLRAWRPEDNWPDVADDALRASLEHWLAPHLAGVTRRAHLAGLDLGALLNGLLDHAQQRALARLAPTHLPEPSGARVALEYFADGAAPALAVKLQELFGLTATPTVNDGRTPVVVHLLSPARRPVAVTRDLASFWARTYPEVKKELKGRYPKHPWPEDPLAAPPTARTKRRS